MSRVAVLGCKGMLGRSLLEALARRGEDAPQALDLPFDVADPDAVRGLVERDAPEVILNAAAYTNVDGAESEPGAARRANVEGPRVLAEAASRTGALLVHVSTDYVFGGRKRSPYVETDPASPEGVYARTKLAGEEAVRGSGARHLIVRSAWLYAPWGRNFVLTILAKAKQGAALRVVDDQRGSPTYAPDLARAVLDLVRAGAEGTFHAVNSGEATWFDLASEAVKLAGLDVPMTRVTTEEFPRPAPRPAYSVLSTVKLERALGRPLRPWQEALAECVERLGGEERAAAALHESL